MSAADSPDTGYQLFVSYAHADDADGRVRALVAALAAEVAGRLGREPLVFFDRQAIRAMDDWEHRILGGSGRRG